MANITTSYSYSYTNTFAYPACRDQPTGPCQLQSSSADLCTRQQQQQLLQQQNQTRVDFYAVELCKCTNGYYNQSSQCWIDCYHASATSRNVESISIEEGLVRVKCESYSLAALSQSRYYESISSASVSRERTANGSASATTTRASQGASVGGAGTPVATTTDWADRPTASVQTGMASEKGRGKGGWRRRRGWLISSMVVMLVMTI